MTLKTEALRSYETSANLYQSTWHKIPKDFNLHVTKFLRKEATANSMHLSELQAVFSKCRDSSSSSIRYQGYYIILALISDAAEAGISYKFPYDTQLWSDVHLYTLLSCLHR